jgi:hypothetical protein
LNLELEPFSGREKRRGSSMALPKWIVPAGLAAAVVATLAFLRKPSPSGGDLVAANAGRLLLNGQPFTPPVAIPPGYAVVVRLDAVQPLLNEWRGTVAGWVDPATNEAVVSPQLVGGPSVTIPKAAVLGLYRGMPLKKVA